MHRVLYSTLKRGREERMHAETLLRGSKFHLYDYIYSYYNNYREISGLTEGLTYTSVESDNRREALHSYHSMIPTTNFCTSLIISISFLGSRFQDGEACMCACMHSQDMEPAEIAYKYNNIMKSVK